MASKMNGTKEEYGKVIISLENCLLPTEKLIETPSMKDGLIKEVETSIRIVGCEFIQAAGILLKLPQVAMATGQVIFQRFFYSKSFVKHDAEVYAMACIFLAAKIEEAPRRIRDVINVFHYIKQKRNNREKPSIHEPHAGRVPIQHMDYMGSAYFNRKNLVVKAERRVLKELGFCVHVKHPHKIIINYLRILECENNQELTRLAWNYMNDSLRTNVFVRFPPETIACACIFLSARKLKICLPNKPYWFELFDATLEDLEEISLTILELYNQPKVSLEELLKKTSELRAEIEEKKKKAAEDKSQGATNSSNKPKPESRPGSRATSPSKTSPFSGGEETKRKGSSKPEEEKKPTELKDRNTSSKQNRRSRSPRNRNRSGSKSRSLSRSHSRSRSKSRSRSHSRSRSRSRSYSLSVSPDVRHASDSFSSDAESPEQRRPLDKDRKGRSTVRPTKSRPRHRSRERRPDKKTPKPTYFNRERTYDRRPRARPRSRSPITRSRSRSPVRDKSKRYHSKHDRERPKSGDYYRNGVDYRTRDREEGGRDHSRRHR